MRETDAPMLNASPRFVTLAQYWTALLQRYNSDHDAAEALLGQIAKGYLIFDRPFPTGRNAVSFDPPLRSGSRRRNPHSDPKSKTDDGVQLTADDFLVTLATDPARIFTRPSRDSPMVPPPPFRRSARDRRP